MAKYVVRVARSAGLIALFIIAAALGITTGVIFAYAGDLPQISALDDYAPSTISRVYGARGEVVGEFAIQRREVIPYEAISPKLRQAIIAAEDSEFEQHFGLSIPRIVMTLLKDIIERRKAAGASTLTQQLARKLFLTDEKTWERKIKEALLAIQIEKRYTKREIFTLYCNQMYFGHGVYGVEAASQLYFGKSAKDLTLEEAALIAGILQGNVRQSPYVNMDAALRRRNYTLGRMAEVGFITADEAEEARKKPIVTARRTLGASPPSPRTSSKRSARNWRPATAPSVSTKTALDPDRARRRPAGGGQPRARRRPSPHRSAAAVSGSLVATCSPRGTPIDTFRHPRWDHPMEDRRIVPAVVTSADGAAIELRAGPINVDRRQKRLRLDAQNVSDTTRRTWRPRRSPAGDARRHGPHRDRNPGAAAAGRGSTARDRQPHRPDQDDGGWVQFRAQQVQPRDPGVTAGRLRVQADRLHRCNRPGLYADDDAHGRADDVSGGPARPPTHPSITIASSKVRSRCGTRSKNRGTSRPCGSWSNSGRGR